MKKAIISIIISIGLISASFGAIGVMTPAQTYQWAGVSIEASGSSESSVLNTKGCEDVLLTFGTFDNSGDISATARWLRDDGSTLISSEALTVGTELKTKTQKLIIRLTNANTLEVVTVEAYVISQ